MYELIIFCWQCLIIQGLWTCILMCIYVHVLTWLLLVTLLERHFVWWLITHVVVVCSQASHYCSITFTLHLLITVSSSPTIFPLFLSLVYSFIRVCKSHDGCCCFTVECKSQMLPWKLLLRLFSNVLFLLLGKSYSLIKFYCWLRGPFSVDLSSCKGLGRV